MLGRFRDWLITRVRARTKDEAARATARAALAAPQTPSADFGGELERALGRADANHAPLSAAPGKGRGGERGER